MTFVRGFVRLDVHLKSIAIFLDIRRSKLGPLLLALKGKIRVTKLPRKGHEQGPPSRRQQTNQTSPPAKRHGKDNAFCLCQWQWQKAGAKCGARAVKIASGRHPPKLQYFALFCARASLSGFFPLRFIGPHFLQPISIYSSFLRGAGAGKLNQASSYSLTVGFLLARFSWPVSFFHLI